MLRAEDELLLSCARTRMDARWAARIHGLLCGGRLNWAYLIDTARRHALVPLLHRNLAVTSPRLVPATVRDELKQRFLIHVARSLSLTRELCGIIKLLGSRGIAAIPFKGPALASFAYGDSTLRTPGDLDILLRQNAADEAGRLLASRGYRPYPPLNPTQESVLRRVRAARTYYREDAAIFADIHWALLRKPLLHGLRPESLWRRLERVRLNEEFVPCLSREDMLLVACSHGAKHGWRRLVWICDVSELASRFNARNWDRVLKRARRGGCRRMLLLGLRLATELLGTTLPRDVLSAVKTAREVDSLAHDARVRLFSDTAGDQGILENHLFLVRSMERARDRLRYLYHAVAAPTEIEAGLVPLPRRLAPAYSLLRPLRIMVTQGRNALCVFRALVAAERAPAANLGCGRSRD